MPFFSHLAAQENFDLRHSWGQYSPYFDQMSSIPAETPAGCDATLVQVLSRHGSRFPTSSKSATYAKLFDRFVPQVPKDALVGPYACLANYTYSLGADVMTIVGKEEMADLASDIYDRYASLIGDNETAVPFVRASGSGRVIESAEIFTQILKLRLLDDLPPSTNPDEIPDIPLLVLPEKDGFNNTLDRHLCSRMKEKPFNKIAQHAQNTFADHSVLPITNRLNAEMQLHGVGRLNIKDTTYLMDVCAFETVALLHPFPPSNRTADGTGISPICDIFSDADFHVYDYYQTLGKYYGWSHGNPLSPSTGVGFVNELIARLTGKPVHDATSTNHTLDADPATFPLGELEDGRYARVFADFSHDNTMAAIHAALGLFEDAPLLPVTRIARRDETGGFGAARTVPFGGRTVVEKLKCKGRHEEDVRVIVNNRVMPLETCGGDKLGRCSLSKFVESLSWARSGGDWDMCFT